MLRFDILGGICGACSKPVFTASREAALSGSTTVISSVTISTELVDGTGSTAVGELIPSRNFSIGEEVEAEGERRDSHFRFAFCAAAASEILLVDVIMVCDDAEGRIASS